MKFFIHWLMATLLVIEPAMAVQINSGLQADFKKFIEETQVTQKEVSFAELFQKISPYLPAQEKARWAPFIKSFGSVKLPKMDLSKVKTPGGEVYKLSGSANGQAVSYEFYGEVDQFAKMNGKNLSVWESASTGPLMAKAGLPEKNIAEAFAQKTTVNSPKLLSAEQIAKLPRAEQIKYIKNFQALLASLEAFQKVSGKTKSASNSLIEKLEIFSKIFLQDYAWAMKVGDKCVAAGYVTTVEKDKKGWLRCGVEKGQVGVQAELRKLPDGTTCPVGEFACNRAVFGSNNNYCAPAGADTTVFCINAVKDSDIPDFANSLESGNAKEFNELKALAEKEAELVVKQCESITKLKNVNRLVEDQKKTCGDFQKRWETIQSWGCDKEEFKSKYPKICPAEPAAGGSTPGQTGADQGQAQVGGGSPQAQTGNPAQQTGAGSGLTACSYLLELPHFSTSSACVGPGGVESLANVKCLDASAKEVTRTDIYKCTCSGKDATEKNKCSAPAAAAGGNSEGGFFSSVGKWMKKNSRWLVPLGFGLLGLGLFHWMAKRSAKQYYNYLNPIDQNPPVAPVAPTAPVPRGTQ